MCVLVSEYVCAYVFQLITLCVYVYICLFKFVLLKEISFHCVSVLSVYMVVYHWSVIKPRVQETSDL